jgi:phosphatidylserine/phosphatidylglycerophosphate/cardiolipin synthase-like enzyme
MMDNLLSLSRSDLLTLAAAIRSRRLNAPYTALSLGRFLATESATAASNGLCAMADSGMDSQATASVLEMLATAVSQRLPLDEMVDLVTTGPPLSGAGSRNTSVVVGDLFRHAQESVLVAGYAVYQGQRVFKSLAERMVEQPRLRVRMYLDIQRGQGDTSSPAELVRRFIHRFSSSEWPNGFRMPEIFFDPRALANNRSERVALHAKCVVVDETDVFVSSANFTEAAQERNIEVGLLLHSPQIALRLTEFFSNLAESSIFQRAL